MGRVASATGPNVRRSAAFPIDAKHAGHLKGAATKYVATPECRMCRRNPWGNELGGNELGALPGRPAWRRAARGTFAMGCWRTVTIQGMKTANGTATPATKPGLEKKAVAAFLRGVNVGSGNPIRMEKLRAICGSLGLEDTITHVQSGNAIFLTKETNLEEITDELETTIEAECGFHSSVVLRTVSDLEAIVAANPFEGRPDLNPSRLLVTFLYKDPGEEAREAVRIVDTLGEELFAQGRELYVYYTNGVGKTMLKERVLNKALGTMGTSRNWNTVTKVLELATALENGTTSAPK